MKRWVFLLTLIAVLCVAASALAISLTFAQTCTEKLSRSVTLYVFVEGEDKLQSAQTLEAGTYVKTNGLSKEGKTGITYGFELYGYIDGSAITSAVKSITLPSGRTVTVPEALVNSSAALNHWLDMEYGETLSGSTYTDANGTEHELGNEAALDEDATDDGQAKWSRAMGLAYAHNGSTHTLYQEDDGTQTPVTVCYMGLARSMVVLDGEKRMVETWRLSWETEASEDKVLAVILPKDAGEVRFYATDKENATILKRVPTNTVVQVIKTGKNFTLVDTNDEESPRGYVHTSILQFYPNEQIEYKAAKLSVLGRTKGSDPVWIRSKGSSKARRITQFDLGEPMSVLNQDEETGWSEVDVGGYHAFILSEFVTISEDETEETP